jgi:hypothetical protein
MKPTRFVSCIIVSVLLAAASLAQASTATGTVTNKTTNKPAVGDSVVLVDTQAGMREVARTNTDSSGRYTLNLPGNTPYLIRVNHQGATYFIAAPSDGKSGDITVYDAAAQIEGVALSADVFECETSNGILYVNERYFIHNTSMPPRTQYNAKGFEIILPLDAVLDAASATRPGGLATNIQLKAGSQKGRYIIDFPIQPSVGDKETLFKVSYHVPYAAGKYLFSIKEPMAADNVAVLLPMSMNLSSWSGANFTQVQEDPGILTFIAKNAAVGKTIEFTVSGSGEMPRENQGTSGQQSSADNTASGQPGGGLGTPINTPDPLSKYKWWILGILVLILATVAALLLRKPALAAATASGASATFPAAPGTYQTPVAATNRSSQLLDVLKDELFTLESEKISGTISAEEYAETKSALETVLRRVLKRNG